MARLLARRFNRAVHLESDVFFDFIQSGRIEPWKSEAHEQNRIAMRAVAAAAAAYATSGYVTIIEGIIIPGWFFEPQVIDVGTAAPAEAADMVGERLRDGFLRA